MKVTRVTKKRPCRICGSPDWCGIAADESAAFCMRVSSDKQAKNGAYLHVLEGGRREVQSLKFKVRSSQPKTTGAKCAFDLDEVYSEFLSHLVLSKKHEADLKRRGLGMVDIHIGGYRSMPPQSWGSRLAQNLNKLEFNLTRVPGFYRLTDWHFRTYNLSGYLIPIKNFEHKIIGLQLRTDEGQKWADGFAPKYLMISSEGKTLGTSSGTPPHFATVGNLTPNSQVESAIITEGALKANIIQTFTGEAVVGLVGIGTFGENFPRLLKTAFPNLKKCKIAFDIEKFDPVKPDSCAFAHVRRHRSRLAKFLRHENLKVQILSWDPGFKGLDDFLLNQNQNLLKQAA